MLTPFVAFALMRQEGEKPKYTPRKAKANSSAPVTLSEARAVFVRLGRNIAMVHPQLPSYAPKVAEGKTPLTAAQAETELRRLAIWTEPAFVITRQSRKRLGDVKWFRASKFVSPNGPIVLGYKQLTTAQFGDAVGYFIVRVADLTHRPSHEYSPSIMGG